MQGNFFNTEKPLWLIQIPSLLAAHARSAQAEQEKHAKPQRHTCNSHIWCEGSPSSPWGLNRVSQKRAEQKRYAWDGRTHTPPGTLISMLIICVLVAFHYALPSGDTGSMTAPRTAGKEGKSNAHKETYSCSLMGGNGSTLESLQPLLSKEHEERASQFHSSDVKWKMGDKSIRQKKLYRAQAYRL